MSTNITPPARKDLAERVGRWATGPMLVRNHFERHLVEVGASYAAGATLECVEKFFGAEAFADFVEAMRDSVARAEEIAS